MPRPSSYLPPRKKKWAGLFLAFCSSFAIAQDLPQELPPGTIVDASNWESLKTKTFLGKPLDDLLIEGVKTLIQDHGLRLELAAPKPISWDDTYKALTAKYSSQVRFDPKTRNVLGYTAGIPFPDIDPADPNAGDKVIWNAFYAFPSHGGNSFAGPMWTFLIDGKGGLDKVQKWQFFSLPLVGRLDPPHALGDGTIAKKEAIFAVSPQDIRGIGTYTIRYVDGRSDDTWVYIKAVRRARRVAGSAWMDPVGGADYLLDDINGFNAHPTWYKSFRYLGKKTILAFWLHNPPKDASTKEGPLSYIDVEHPPHWLPKFSWEPVEVHEVEATPPEHHPYGKKILYYSVEHPGVIHQALFYDKKGKLWKVDLYGVGVAPDEKGRLRMTRYIDFVIDLKSAHATVAVGDGVRSVAINPDALGPSILERGSL